MRVQVDTRDVPCPDGTVVPVHDITVWHWPYDRNISQYLLGMTEHNIRDLEFVLAQRRAMSKRCTVTHREHTCGLDVAHGTATQHSCRACDAEWPWVGGTGGR